jgi:hypothetical protein
MPRGATYAPRGIHFWYSTFGVFSGDAKNSRGVDSGRPRADVVGVSAQSAVTVATVSAGTRPDQPSLG